MKSRELLVQELFERAGVPMSIERPHPELENGPGNADIQINSKWTGFTFWGIDQVCVAGPYSGLYGSCTHDYRFTVHITDVPQELLEEAIAVEEE